MQTQPSHPSAQSSTAAQETCYLFSGLELHLTSPLYWRERIYPATGFVHLASSGAALDEGSVRIRSLATGLAEEVFLDKNGAFVQELELEPEKDNALEFAVCDELGREIGCVVIVVCHQSTERAASVSERALPSLTLPVREARSPILDPPWPRFAQLVQRCLNMAAEVADKTGRDAAELCDPIRAQERYAEKAYEERNQTLYHECEDNLEKYRGYLAQLLGGTLPRPSRSGRPPEEEARAAIDRFRANLSSVWKQVRHSRRADLETHLRGIAEQACGISKRVKKEPHSVLREAIRLGAEVEKVAALLACNRRQATEDNPGKRSLIE